MIIANDGKLLVNTFQFYSWPTVSYVQLGDETEWAVGQLADH